MRTERRTYGPVCRTKDSRAAALREIQSVAALIGATVEVTDYGNELVIHIAKGNHRLMVNLDPSIARLTGEFGEHWHSRAPATYPDGFLGGDVNPFHHGKATKFVRTLDDLLSDIAAGFAIVAPAPDAYTEGVTKRPVTMLRPGDRVDLAGDPIADPRGGTTDGAEMGDSDHPEFEFEFECVDSTAFEYHDVDPCVVVNFESGLSFGFPADHAVAVDDEQVRGPRVGA